MAANKTKPAKQSVPDYLNELTDVGRKEDAEKLVQMMQQASGETPKMWGTSIVGFGSYHYVYASGREGDTPLVGFALRKTAMVLYGLSRSGDCEALLGKLGKYTTGVGCLYIKKLADVDLTVLERLIGRSVSAKRSG